MKSMLNLSTHESYLQIIVDECNLVSTAYPPCAQETMEYFQD